jgi:hypothetical protein
LQIVLARLDALARWNEVGRTVAACASREKAAVALVESGFDAQWVDHILDMRLTERTIEGLVTLERERDELLSRLRS